MLASVLSILVVLVFSSLDARKTKAIPVNPPVVLVIRSVMSLAPIAKMN